MNEWNEKQVSIWDSLYEQVTGLLAQYGKEDSVGKGDYWVNEDNYGWRRIIIEVQDLKMLTPEIVSSLRSFLTDLPDWEIVAAINPPDKKGIWPIMGLTIRKHEIIDGLQRQYFPAEFHNLKYEGSRPGTGYD